MPFDYEKLTVKYVTEQEYTPDFGVGSNVIIEAKGYFTSEDRTKLKLVRAQHPDLDIRLLFQRASNKLNKRSSTTYAQWADKHGFKWAEGTVPESWLKPVRKERLRASHSRRGIARRPSSLGLCGVRLIRLVP